MAQETQQKPIISKAHLGFIRQTARKVRRTANLLRNMKASDALAQLNHLPFAAATPIRKLIKSAMANAAHNLSYERPEDLIVSQLLVDDATMYKRWRAANKGRAYRILKRNSQLSVVLSEMNQAQYAKYIWDVSPRNRKNWKKDKDA